jgi:predicted HicB family RNase H-like nuclease
MKYKGYTGTVELDEDSGILFGQVIGLRDVITFQGESVAEVIQAFHDSVDDYLEFCEVRGESPEKPYSGHFVVRLGASLHRELANAALARQTSLNALVETTLADFFAVDSAKKEVTVVQVRSHEAKKTVEPAPKAKSSRTHSRVDAAFEEAARAFEGKTSKGEKHPPAGTVLGKAKGDGGTFTGKDRGKAVPKKKRAIES